MASTTNGYEINNNFIYSYYKSLDGGKLSDLSLSKVLMLAINGNQEAEEEVIRRHIDKIYNIASSLYSTDTNASIDDLLQVGIISCIEYIRSFTEIPANFRSECSRRINTDMRKYLKDNKFEVVTVSDEVYSLDDIIQTNMNTEEINKIIEFRLTETESYVIRCYYGFIPGFNSCASIAKELNRSRSRIQQIRNKSLRKIKRYIRFHKNRYYRLYFMI